MGKKEGKKAKKKPMNLVPLSMSDMTNEYPAFYSVVIKGKICGSAHPSMTSLKEQMAVLRKNENVRGLLSLTRNGVDAAVLEAVGVAYLHLPTQDKCPLTIRDLVVGSMFVDSVNADGGMVLVHCREGIGRTGTMIAGWMILSMGMDAREAVQQVRAIRPGSIHQHHQELRLYQLERVLQEHPDNLEKVKEGVYDESSLDFGVLKAHVAHVMARMIKRFTISIYFFKLLNYRMQQNSAPLPGKAIKIPKYQHLERSPHWKPKLTSFETYTGEKAELDQAHLLAGSFNLSTRHNSMCSQGAPPAGGDAPFGDRDLSISPGRRATGSLQHPAAGHAGGAQGLRNNCGSRQNSIRSAASKSSMPQQSGAAGKPRGSVTSVPGGRRESAAVVSASGMGDGLVVRGTSFSSQDHSSAQCSPQQQRRLLGTPPGGKTASTGSLQGMSPPVSPPGNAAVSPPRRPGPHAASPRNPSGSGRQESDHLPSILPQNGVGGGGGGGGVRHPTLHLEGGATPSTQGMTDEASSNSQRTASEPSTSHPHSIATPPATHTQGLHPQPPAGAAPGAVTMHADIAAAVPPALVVAGGAAPRQGSPDRPPAVDDPDAPTPPTQPRPTSGSRPVPRTFSLELEVGK